MTHYRIIQLIFLFSFFSIQLNSQPVTGEGFIAMPDGTQLFYKKFGTKGDTLIMLHGGPGQNMYGIGPDLEILARNNILIMYDQRGCGNSEAGKDTVTFTHHVNDLEAIRKYFKVAQMVLVGQSWGAMLSVLYTSAYPGHVKALFLISPGPPTRKLFDERFRSFLKRDSIGQARVAQLRSQLTGENALSACNEIFAINDRFYFADTAAIKRKRGDYCSVTKEAVRKQAISGLSTLRSLGNYDLGPLGAQINQPVLLTEGAKSPVPPAEMEYWSRSFPNCSVYIFPKSGHGYPFVEEPDRFLNVALKFLSGINQN